MTDLDALLDSAALPERTVEVCLRGDLVAQVEDLERELGEAQTISNTMAEVGKRRQLAEKIEALRVEMRDSAIVFRLRGLNRHQWADLMTVHPPREGEESDAALGYNTDTFFPALVRACIYDPAIDDDQWQRLDAKMTSKQFDELVDAALAVSRRKVNVPFSLAASATLLTSGETSKPQSA